MTDIDITISKNPGRGSHKRSVRQGRRRGTLHTRTKRDELDRRHQPQDLILKFWDLGYRKNESGEFATTPYPVISPPGILGHYTEELYVQSPTIHHFNSLCSEILTVDLANFHNTYYQITKSVSRKYLLFLTSLEITDTPDDTLLDDLPLDKWTEDGELRGFRVADLSRLRFGQILEVFNPDIGSDPRPLFVCYDINDRGAIDPEIGRNDRGLRLMSVSPQQKVTSLPSFLSPAVPMSLSGTVNVFLAPDIAYSVGRTLSFPLDTIPLVSKYVTSYLNYVLLLLPREKLLVPTFPYYDVFSTYFGYNATESEALEVVAAHSVYSGRAFTVSAYVGLVDHTFHVELYPHYFVVFTPGYDVMGDVGYTTTGSLNGVLKAIVECNGSWFYIWTDNMRPQMTGIA